MKAILITVALSTLFLFILKLNVGGSKDMDVTTSQSPIQTVETQCAVPVNGVIYGHLPPCDMFPSFNKNKDNRKKFQKPYIVDNVAYKNYHDFSNQRDLKENARRQAQREYKYEYKKGLRKDREIHREIAYASTRARAEKREAKFTAKRAKKERIKTASQKGLKAKSRVVKCKDSAGKVFYSNNCSGHKTEKELRIVKLPKRDYDRRTTYKGNDKKYDEKLSSTIIYKKPKEKEYSSLAEREKDTRKTYETMFKNSGFSRTEKKRKVDEYVEKTMSVFK